MPNVPSITPDPLLPDFRWNATAHRYIDTRGRFVSSNVLRGQLDTALDRLSTSVASLSDNLRAGSVTLAEWQTQMMANVKSAHVMGGALERGGFYQLTQSDFGRIGAITRREYAYLRDFAAQIESGKQKLDGTLVRRAQLYAQQGRSTYYTFAERSAEQQGFDEERSVLTPADHCFTCVAQEKQGFVPIGAMVPIGQRDCRSNCRCYVEYRNSKTGEVRRA